LNAKIPYWAKPDVVVTAAVAVMVVPEPDDTATLPDP
jgi:hypothetical protein